MQTESVVINKISPRKTLKQQLIDLPIGTEVCLTVTAAKVGTLYTTCNNLRKLGMNFKTQKNDDKVNVWRIA